MESLIFPILIALTVGMGCWGLTRVFPDENRGQRKKLAQRLSTEGKVGATMAGPENRQIVLQLDVAGLPPFLARQPIIQRLHRRLIQAYPRLTVVRFLGIAAGFAFT